MGIVNFTYSLPFNAENSVVLWISLRRNMKIASEWLWVRLFAGRGPS